MRYLIAAAAVLGLAGSAIASVINVPGDYSTIQAAVNAASNGDEVVVAPGVYSGAGSGTSVVSISKSIVLRSSGGHAVTFIDGAEARRGIYCNGVGDSTRIEGFTIRNGRSPDGGAIFCRNSSPNISSCKMEFNRATGNSWSAGRGGAVYCEYGGTLQISDCEIVANAAVGNGGWNWGGYGGAIYADSNTTAYISNSTVCSNSSPIFDGDGEVINGGGNDFDDTCSGLVPGACCSVDFNGDTYCFYVDEYSCFLNYFGEWQGEYVLCEFNPCATPPAGACCNGENCSITTQAGCNGDWLGEGTDCSGNPCYAPPTGACCNGENCSITTQAGCNGDWLGEGTDCSGNPCYVPPTGACCINGSCTVTTEADCSSDWLGEGTDCSGNPCYVPPTGACCINGSCTVTTAAGCSGDWLGEDTDCASNPCETKSDWIVDDDGPADFDNIQDAVLAAVDGDVVTVMPGTYRGNGDSVVDLLGKSITLIAAGTTEETIIDGQDSRRGIICNTNETDSTVINGFTITGGSTNYSGGGIYCHNSSPTLTDCTISGNTATDGGGIYCANGSSPTLSGCTISNNSGWGSGGGIYCGEDSSPTISDCTITNNSARTGGGICCDDQSSPAITNCIISTCSAYDNDNGGGGIACLSNSTATISGCTISENTSTGTHGGGVYTPSDLWGPACNDDCPTSRPFISNSIICGNAPNQIGGPWSDEGDVCLALSCSDADEDGAPDECAMVSDGIHEVPGEYSTIQQAINTAGSGDVVLVGPGTWYGSGDEVFSTTGKPITIRSTHGPDVTVLDGQDERRGIKCDSGEMPSTIIEGFTIRNGITDSSGGGYRYGGGILCYGSSPTIRDCIITENRTPPNTADVGAGIALARSESLIENCIISNNHSDVTAGVFALGGAVQIVNSEIKGNVSEEGLGGGIYVWGPKGDVDSDEAPLVSLDLADSAVVGNQSGKSGYLSAGGLTIHGSAVTALNCSFTDNNCVGEYDSELGGGITSANSHVELLDCVISDNESAEVGGGFANYHYYDGRRPYLLIQGCSFTSNNSLSLEEGSAISGLYSNWCEISNTTVCGSGPLPVGGSWQDGGGNWIDDWCSYHGACCNNGSCAITTEADCGGTWLGAGTDCSGNPCNAPVGACCINGSCTVTTQAECSDFWLGEGSDCSSNPCDADWTVDDDGPADFNNIQDAINAASHGDEILVAPGDYTAPGIQGINLLGKAITIRASGTAEETRLYGSTVRRVVQCAGGEGPDTVIDGFTITGGSADDGGGIYCSSSSPTISNCIITNNTANNNGGGVYCGDNSNPTISNCIITNNTANDNGSGVYCGDNSNPTLTECTILTNTAEFGAGIYCYNGSSPTITDCAITNNTADGRGGGVYCRNGSNPTIIACAITNNTANGAGGGAGICCIYSSSPTITDCAITNNTANGAGGGIYCLVSSSPTITGCTISGNTATTSGLGGGVYCSDGNPTLSNTTVCGNDPTQIFGLWTDGGGVCVSFSCDDSDGDGVPDKCQGSIGDGIHEVPSEYTTIQGAIEAAGYGDTVLVAPGTYTGSGNWVINPSGKAITIRASGTPEETILDGGAWGLVQCTGSEGPDTVIEGFTIRGGASDFSGGGILCFWSSPTISNCIITNNTAVWGGGIYCYNGSPTIMGCTITNNIASEDGGGIYCHNGSNPTITNCEISGNDASDRGGGILSMESSPMLAYTVVCGNAPDQIDGDWTDNGGNTITDACPLDCPDINGDGEVGVDEILAVIAAWNTDDADADVNGDGIVDTNDILLVLAAWGPCP